ncbi:MAG: HNH endonuclease [Alphaproteobacteria bacterium]|nr:HNH endonuclease [Alphaproteobacteria bacterium]
MTEPRQSSAQASVGILDDWTHWAEILLRDRVQCVYCGLDGTQNLQTFWQLIGHHHLDDLVPRKLGGDNTPANLVTCCWPCNRRKSDFDPRDRNPDGTLDSNTPRGRMIENVRARLRSDWDYFDKARKEFISQLADSDGAPSNAEVTG